MGELNEIKKLIMNLQHDMNERLDSIEEKLDHTAQREELKAVANTLEYISEETAVSLEQKQQTGDVLLKAHIDYVQKDIKELKEIVVSGFERTGENFQQIYEIMQTLSQTQDKHQQEINILKRASGNE
ncbi:hypothetical protein IC620_01295 [Hazenella sp. IB182357]|uniref:Uncharacterized protein n=1 Tax=Polycladospora coralii TaxID=2771432 RepID=A0A926NCN7_9BACL|nr:hypothetical protein [Polycladospora coralii]MBD1370998.1 hypothetical protein [Polycladospora coralii]MBS7529937.1 hypothetical protein [Polycladospora coralii]